MTEEILAGLKWLGIIWDEGPFFQSDNFEKYKKHAELLIQDKSAYHCYCLPGEIEKRKNKNGKRSYKYDRKCFELTEIEIKKFKNLGRKPVIRFYIPDGKTSFKDKIHKKLNISNEELEDFILLKSDGTPTYHISVVIDDNDMKITHVLRGDDHLSNTFKQILLYRALGFQPPEFYHLPLILGKDKKKLSKRHGEISVLEFKERGYLPEALLTYLAQLSWNPGDYKKIFLMDELVEKIDFTKLSKNNPEFDYNKLTFLNSKAIQKKPASEIFELLIEDKEFKKKFNDLNEVDYEKFINLIKPRMKTLLDIKDKFSIYFNKNLTYLSDDIIKVLDSEKKIQGMILLIEKLTELDEFNTETTETILRRTAENFDLKAADLIHPSRLAITTENVSPGIFQIFDFFGKEESIKRLNHFIKEVKKIAFPD